MSNVTLHKYITCNWSYPYNHKPDPYPKPDHYHKPDTKPNPDHNPKPDLNPNPDHNPNPAKCCRTGHICRNISK